MGAKLTFDTVTGANVYMNGASLYGKALEISGLSINPVMKDISPIGMFGKKKVMTGIDALSVDVTWEFINEKVTNPFKDYNLKIYGNVVRRENGTDRSLKAYMELRGRMGDNDLMGTLKGQEWSGQKTKFELDYILVKHDGEEILEIDVENNVFKDHGEDMLADMRKNANL